MTSGRVASVAAAVVSVAWASAAAAQGLYWESTVSGIGSEARTAQIYSMPKMMKVLQADGKAVILRADQNKFITVDTKKRTYREMSFAEMESAAKSMQGQMELVRAEMEKRMKEMTPEQRAMMEKMLPKAPGAAAAAVVVKNTGETKTISGYACTKYVATENGKPMLVAWTTKDVKGFETLRDDWLAYQKRLVGTNPTLGSAMVDAYAKIDGFPMETEMGGIKTVVTKVEARSTPATEFEVPAGYKQESVNLQPPPHK
jgi:hypothetical protein